MKINVLKDLAIENKNDHGIVVDACKSAVEHAMKAGRIFIVLLMWLITRMIGLPTTVRLRQALMKFL